MYYIYTTCGSQLRKSSCITRFFYEEEKNQMTRVQAACICQTLHFMLKDTFSYGYAAKLVKDDVERYKATLIKNNTQYKIVSEETQPDGSIVVKIIKQYNACPVGNYLD